MDQPHKCTLQLTATKKERHCAPNLSQNSSTNHIATYVALPWPHIQVKSVNFLQVMWITRSNEKKPDHPGYILKMAIIDLEFLSTSYSLTLLDCFLRGTCRLQI